MSEQPSIEERIRAVLLSEPHSLYGEFRLDLMAARPTHLMEKLVEFCRDLVREENEACEAICNAEAGHQKSIGIIEEAAGAWSCAAKLAARRTTA